MPGNPIPYSTFNTTITTENFTEAAFIIMSSRFKSVANISFVEIIPMTPGKLTIEVIIMFLSSDIVGKIEVSPLSRLSNPFAPPTWCGVQSPGRVSRLVSRIWVTFQVSIKIRTLAVPLTFAETKKLVLLNSSVQGLQLVLLQL